MKEEKKVFFLKKVSTYKYPITQRFHYFFFLLSFFAFLFQLLFFCVIIAIRSFCFHGALGVNFDQFRQRRMERSKQKRPEEKNKSKKNKIYFLLIWTVGKNKNKHTHIMDERKKCEISHILYVASKKIVTLYRTTSEYK